MWAPKYITEYSTHPSAFRNFFSPLTSHHRHFKKCVAMCSKRFMASGAMEHLFIYFLWLSIRYRYCHIKKQKADVCAHSLRQLSFDFLEITAPKGESKIPTWHWKVWSKENKVDSCDPFVAQCVLWSRTAYFIPQRWHASVRRTGNKIEGPLLIIAPTCCYLKEVEEKITA